MELILTSELARVDELLARPDCRLVEVEVGQVCAFDHPLGDGGAGSGLAVQAPAGNATLSVVGEPLLAAEEAEAAARIISALTGD